MTMLERELLAVGADAFPETPELSRAVILRLEREPTPTRRARRRSCIRPCARCVRFRSRTVRRMATAFAASST